MPKFHGIRFEWCPPAALERGDELLLDNGARVTVFDVYRDSLGICVEVTDGTDVIQIVAARYRVVD